MLNELVSCALRGKMHIMSTILAIETSTELASVALMHESRLISCESLGAHTHSLTVLPMVQKLLVQAGIDLADCDALAFGVGPGSFTGIRTACGIVQGLAYPGNLPVLPVGTLLAMAQACHDLCAADQVLALLDARMGEVYWAQYQYRNAVWETVIEPCLTAPAHVAMPPIGTLQVCGNGLTAYPEAFSAILSGWPQVMPHARQIAQLGSIAWKRGEAVCAQQAQPFYLRNKVALTSAERVKA